ncbi:MAG: efflux RND transporter periplasmic adaptor subunit [Myxococcales bacterium]|nr:efflux RND transporter periplasmic adaptor subunit [Myxococcales bacterium]
MTASRTLPRRVLFVALGAAALVVAYRVGQHAERAAPVGETQTAAEHAGHGAVEREPDVWTCVMHPQIRLPKPGKCPICGMELVPVRPSSDVGGGGDATNVRRIALSPEAIALASIETAPVRRAFVSKEVRMVGKVDFDETRVKTISAWVNGRIDRLYVDYTGIDVKEGDHLVSLYSPELLTAQEELIQALRASRELRGSGLSVLRDSADRTIAAARDKLRLLGLASTQIQAVERRGETTDHVTIYAPIGGTVIQKSAVEGMYVKTGMPIYAIADLSKVWVRLDAYESDMAWVRYGQDVAFETEAYPGETFHGTIAFINPVLNPTTRTVNVRVNVPNTDGRLKPEMFVRAVVRAGVASGGRVMDPRLSGKWIGPMHPEIVRDKPGKCPICGMDLVRAETLGYVPGTPEDAPLVIPSTAPLVTGERAVVYVRVPGAEAPTFEGREIVLGPRAAGAYVVRAGLAEGEEVVAKGAFYIDSALQIQAKPSMMSPEGGGAPPMHHHGASHDPAGADAHEPPAHAH